MKKDFVQNNFNCELVPSMIDFKTLQYRNFIFIAYRCSLSEVQ